MNEKLNSEVISKLFETLSKLKIGSAYDRFKQSIIDDLVRLGFSSQRATELFDEMESANKQKSRNYNGK